MNFFQKVYYALDMLTVEDEYVLFDSEQFVRYLTGPWFRRYENRLVVALTASILAQLLRLDTLHVLQGDVTDGTHTSVQVISNQRNSAGRGEGI